MIIISASEPNTNHVVNFANRPLSRVVGVWRRFALSAILACSASFTVATFAQTEIITNFAGSGAGAFAGDGGQATAAFLSLPNAVAFDRAGNAYIADLRNSRIRLVNPAGVISTFAGGTSTTLGDGGPALNARLLAPAGLAMDSSGALYIADRNDHRIRRISPTGIITTIAGTGTLGFSGDGGAATSAQLFGPNAVAVDAIGNVYIVDGNNNRVRRIDTNGIITTYAGNGQQGFAENGIAATSASISPVDVKIDPQGNVLIVATGRVNRVNAQGIIFVIAGGGSNEIPAVGSVAATSVGLRASSVAVDRAGNTYIAEASNDVIFRVDTQGQIIRFAGYGFGSNNADGVAAINTNFGTILRLSTSPAGDLFVSQGDTTRHRVRKITLSTPPSARGTDLDGLGRSAIVLRSSGNDQLIAGRLVNNSIQWTNMADPGPAFRLIAPIDFAGNGKSDLPMLRETPLNANGQGVAQYWNDFSGATQVFLRDVKPAWDVQAVGDLDGDGLGDLVWRFRGQSPNIDDQGVSYIWFTGAGGSGVSQVRKRGGAPLTWTLLGAADINGDNAADMVYVSPTNTMRVLMATPNRTCANLNGGSIPVGFNALKLADFANSGRADVLIRNPSTGEVSIIRLNALGLTLPPYAGAPDDPNASCTSSSLSVVTTVVSVGATNPTWSYYASGDFNGDGATDIVWRRPDNTLTAWLMPSTGSGAPTVIDNAGIAPTGAAPLPLQ